MNLKLISKFPVSRKLNHRTDLFGTFEIADSSRFWILLNFHCGQRCPSKAVGVSSEFDPIQPFSCKIPFALDPWHGCGCKPMLGFNWRAWHFWHKSKCFSCFPGYIFPGLEFTVSKVIGASPMVTAVVVQPSWYVSGHQDLEPENSVWNMCGCSIGWVWNGKVI